MDPQEFLAKRVNDIKNILSGDVSIQRAATLFGPGNAPGKAVGLQMLRSAGKPNAGKMSLLGGDAPVYEAPIEKVLDTPIRDMAPGAGGLIQSIL